jgi:hypothetical protein
MPEKFRRLINNATEPAADLLQQDIALLKSQFSLGGIGMPVSTKNSRF